MWTSAHVTSSLTVLNASLMAFKVIFRLFTLVYKVPQDPAPAHFTLAT